MRSFPARFLALAALVPALFLLAVVPGCAKQSEGERCGDGMEPLNDDCGDGLVCKEISSDVYRCCYSNGQISDSRCEKPDAVTGTGGSGGSGGSSGSGGSGGATAGSSSQTDAGTGGGAD